MSVNTVIQGLQGLILDRIAGKGLMDADFNANSRNGLQNKKITQKFNSVDNSITQINSDLANETKRVIATITSNGTRTYSQALDLLYPVLENLEHNVVRSQVLVRLGDAVLQCGGVTAGQYNFFNVTGASGVSIYSAIIKESGSILSNNQLSSTGVYSHTDLSSNTALTLYAYLD